MKTITLGKLVTHDRKAPKARTTAQRYATKIGQGREGSKRKKHW